MLTCSMMRFLSLLLLGLCACVVFVVLWSLCCECDCCGDYDSCTVVRVASEGAKVMAMLVWGPAEVWLQ